MSYYLKWFFAILSWGFAPILLKKYLEWIDIFILCGFILFFAWIPILFTKNYPKTLQSKDFILNSFIISILTIIHYSWNFYWILYWNIILTTLIIKNSPFFQNFIYSILNKKPLWLFFYIIALLLISWVSLATYSDVPWSWINLMYIWIPLISSIAWAFLMIFISKIGKQSEALWTGNILSSCLIGIVLLYIWKIDFPIFEWISYFQYFMLALLWVIPTLIWPILWAQAINESKGRIIFFDYITPIITIVASIFLFHLKLNMYNYLGILIILGSLIVYSLFLSNPKKNGS